MLQAVNFVLRQSWNHAPQATITLWDLLAAILFKLAHSCLNGFNLVQRYIVNSKESVRQITQSKTSLKQFHSYNSLSALLTLNQLSTSTRIVLTKINIDSCHRLLLIPVTTYLQKLDYMNRFTGPVVQILSAHQLPEMSQHFGFHIKCHSSHIFWMKCC